MGARMIASSKGRRRSGSKGDLVLKTVVGSAAIGLVALILALSVNLAISSGQSIETFGLGFITGTVWNSATDVYGAFPFLVGTLVTSAIALLLGVPVSLGVAIFLSERAKGSKSVGTALGSLVELLAAVPSVIYGLWGFAVLVPFMGHYVEPAL